MTKITHGENIAVKEIKGIISQKIEFALKTLLEEKHLYQSVRVSREETKRAIINIKETRNIKLSGMDEFLNEIVDRLFSISWSAINREMGTRQIPFSADTQAQEELDHLTFEIRGIKSLCGYCGEFSPMNLKVAKLIFENLSDGTEPLTESNRDVYMFAFHCQSCRTRKGLESFLVARDGEKLTLVGRSPMEKIQVPNYIPPDQQKYYSSAIIGFNSGQVLPALFLLRTLIEQFARSEITDPSLNSADKVMNEYKATLPDDFKRNFPSLNQIYDELSAAIHTANESTELFIRSKEGIDRHFDARRSFNL